MESEFVDHYQVLGLPALTPTADEIKKAYRKVSLQWHPDKISDESKIEEAQEKMKQINVSNDILSDHQKRKVYDEEYKRKNPYSASSSSSTPGNWDQYYRDIFDQPAPWSPFSSGFGSGYSAQFPYMPEFVFVHRTPSEQQARPSQPAPEQGTPQQDHRGSNNKEHKGWTKEDKPLTPMQNLLLRSYPRKTYSSASQRRDQIAHWYAVRNWEETHLRTPQDWQEYFSCQDFIQDNIP